MASKLATRCLLATITQFPCTQARKRKNGRHMAESKQVTWGGRFGEGPAELMLKFSESVSFDQRLADFDIQGSLAHAAMLEHCGLLSPEECGEISSGLETLRREIADGQFTWDTSLEDVHMNIEQALTARVAAAAKLHTARSRNDQIATDMRLFFKWATTAIRIELKAVMETLLELAEKNQAIAIPGYTHLQRAQPVSAAHHLLAWVEMFGRDRDRLSDIHDRANWCPLGSGAIAGTTLPIDREFTARALGFVDSNGNPRVTRNSMDAVADRDIFIEFAAACTLIGVHFSRIAEDLILWATTEFGFIHLPDTFTTGSSLMPQKKNPDSLELLRGKAGRLHGNLTCLITLAKGLPLTYNRDLQEDKPPVFDACDQCILSLRILRETTRGMRFNSERCHAAVSDPLLLATDLVDYLVLHGVAFRDAHHSVGALVAYAEKQGIALNAIPLDAARRIEPKLDDDWTEVFTVKRALGNRERTGMPGPDTVAAEIHRWQTTLSQSSDG